MQHLLQLLPDTPDTTATSATTATTTTTATPCHARHDCDVGDYRYYCYSLTRLHYYCYSLTRHYCYYQGLLPRLSTTTTTPTMYSLTRLH